MCKFVVLLKFTEKGMSDIASSVERADVFKAEAAKWGALVKPILEAWVKQATAKGLPARAALKFTQQKLAEFSK